MTQDDSKMNEDLNTEKKKKRNRRKHRKAKDDFSTVVEDIQPPSSTPVPVPAPAPGISPLLLATMIHHLEQPRTYISIRKTLEKISKSKDPTLKQKIKEVQKQNSIS
jgi:hypothetical protein